jgi:two-component system, NarL family, sensor kinase
VNPGEHTWQVTNLTAPQLRAVGLGVLGVCLLGTWAVITPQVVTSADQERWYVVVAMVPCLLVSLLLVARLPGAAMTRVIVALTLCHLAGLAIESIRLWRSAHGGPAFSHLAWAAESGGWAVVDAIPFWVGTLPLLPVLLVVFPDGVAPRGWWRYIFIGQMISLVVMLPVLVDQADGVTIGWLVAIGAVAGLFILASGMARTVALVGMWWRSRGERRRQMRPLIVVASILATFYAVSGISTLTTGGLIDDGSVAAGLSYAFIVGALPTAIGLSVLRHRLYGIEVAVNRVAVTAFLSVMLFGVYTTTVAAASTIADGGTRLSWGPLVAAATTVAAVGPLYRLSRQSVDRVMFGDRDRPDRALRHLAARLGETVDPLNVPQTLVDEVARALRLPFVALDRDTEAGPARAAEHGSVPVSGLVVTYPISFGGLRLAVLSVAPRSGEDTLSRPDRALLADLASQAGTALYAGRLTHELAESRERLWQARLDERAHLRRALHDGLSPAIAGIGMAAAAALGRDFADPAVRQLLHRIKDEAGGGSASLRALLEGLRPPGLAELGLVAAIEARAGEMAMATGIAYEVRPDHPLAALSTDVEQAAYLVSVEAMTNVARHAGATQCRITLVNEQGNVVIAVADNGCGMPAQARDGDGLRSAKERLAACGGDLSLGTVAGGGAVFRARLPAWRPA